jgi:hypothetical protein
MELKNWFASESAAMPCEKIRLFCVAHRLADGGFAEVE